MYWFRTLTTIALAIGAISPAIRSRSPPPRAAEVLLRAAPVYPTPKKKGRPIATIRPGAKINILERQGEWSRVALSGDRVGWMTELTTVPEPTWLLGRALRLETTNVAAAIRVHERLLREFPDHFHDSSWTDFKEISNAAIPCLRRRGRIKSSRNLKTWIARIAKAYEREDRKFLHAAARCAFVAGSCHTHPHIYSSEKAIERSLKFGKDFDWSKPLFMTSDDGPQDYKKVCYGAEGSRGNNICLDFGRRDGRWSWVGYCDGMMLDSEQE